MNPNEKGDHVDVMQLDSAQLDRLVDGELTEKERRSLLLEFEKRPGGWRRCAMAFLEAQAFRDALAAAPGRPDEQNRPGGDGGDPSLPQSKRHVKPSKGKSRVHWLAVAASFFVALVLGLSLPRWFEGGHGPVVPPSHIAGGINAVPTAAEDVRRQPPVFSPEDDRGQIARQPADAAAPRDDWRLVSFGNDATTGRQGVTVPCRETNRLDQSWLSGPETRFAPEWADALSDASREVRHDRRHMLIPTDDGRTVIVPVDRLDVRWRTGDEFQ